MIKYSVYKDHNELDLVSQLRKVEEQAVIKCSVYKADVIITSLTSCLRDPAEEGGGAGSD